MCGAAHGAFVLTARDIRGEARRVHGPLLDGCQALGFQPIDLVSRKRGPERHLGEEGQRLVEAIGQTRDRGRRRIPTGRNGERRPDALQRLGQLRPASRFGPPLERVTGQHRQPGRGRVDLGLARVQNQRHGRQRKTRQPRYAEPEPVVEAAGRHVREIERSHRARCRWSRTIERKAHVESSGT